MIPLDTTEVNSAVNLSSEESIVVNTSESVVNGASDKSSSQLPGDSCCIFCKKNRKMHNRRYVQMFTIVSKSTVDSLKSKATEMNDVDFIEIVKTKEEKKELLFYTNICKVSFHTRYDSFVTSKKPKTEWHIIRELHRSVYEYVCSFVQENIIDDHQSYSYN